MLKRILFFLIFTSFFLGFSQQKKRVYDFFGGKTYAKKAEFYRLLFEIENGKIAGYAFTGEQGVIETKSVINGTFDVKSNRIAFRETSKLITNAKHKLEESCYLNGIVTLQLGQRVSTIQGAFISMKNNGSKCYNGNIHIISMDAYKDLTIQLDIEKQIASQFLKNKKEIQKEKKEIVPSFESDEKITIKTDDEIIIYWNSDSIKLTIWDDSKEDNDEISITLNEGLILDKFNLKNDKETFSFDLKEQKNTLVFTANNTGLIGNNTARVDLFDNKIKHQIITQLEKNKSVTVYLIKQ